MSMDNEDRVSRNTLLAVGVSIALAFGAAWVQINSRISMLEVKVQSDHNLYMDSSRRADNDMKELKEKLTDIQVKVTELGTRQDELANEKKTTK